MKFSVIVTVFRRDSLVPRMLHSLASQTHEDWEAIFISDGPHPNAESAVNQFKTETGHPVSWVTGNRRAGTFGNHLRRFGLQNCGGHYVCFISHDCLLDADYLRTHNEQVCSRTEPVISVVSCRYWNLTPWFPSRQPLPIENYRGVLPPPDTSPEQWREGELDLTSVAFPVDVAKRRGVFSGDLDMKYSADWFSYEKCRGIPTVFSQKVVCAHF